MALEQFSMVLVRRARPGADQRYRYPCNEDPPPSRVIGLKEIGVKRNWGAPCLAAFARHGKPETWAIQPNDACRSFRKRYRVLPQADSFFCCGTSGAPYLG